MWSRICFNRSYFPKVSSLRLIIMLCEKSNAWVYYAKRVSRSFKGHTSDQTPEIKVYKCWTLSTLSNPCKINHSSFSDIDRNKIIQLNLSYSNLDYSNSRLFKCKSWTKVKFSLLSVLLPWLWGLFWQVWIPRSANFNRTSGDSNLSK